MRGFLKTEKVFSILELNNAIKQIINHEFPDYVWVCGEIQDLRIRENKKHAYFNLVQKHPEIDEILAKVKAIIFEAAKVHIQYKLKTNNLSLFLRDGIEVKLLCRVNLYAKWGEYRLEVFDIDPVYTLGKVAQARQKILEELKKSGVLDKNKFCPLGVVSQNIGLITASNSAAYHDFLSELKKSGFKFTIFFIDCHMQGKFVETDILKALRYFNRLKEDCLDVIVITRGGGQTSELGVFDSRLIAQEVAKSKFPVISAIGHEINLSVLELASHSYFKTPTKVAHFLVERIKEFMQNIEALHEIILQKSASLLESKKKNLEIKTSKIFNLIQLYFLKHKQNLTKNETLITSQTCKIFKFNSHILHAAFKKIVANYKLNLSIKSRNLNAQEEKVKLLNPKNVLKRGFSITTAKSKALKNPSGLKKQQVIETVLYQGKLKSKVIEIKKRCSLLKLRRRNHEKRP